MQGDNVAGHLDAPNTAVTHLRRKYQPIEIDQTTVTIILRCVVPVVCRKTNGEVNISHENTAMVVWIYDGV